MFKKKRHKTTLQTATQFVGDFVKKASEKVELVKKQDIVMLYVCRICIFLFSFSLLFGLYDFVSNIKEISNKKQSIELLENELLDLKKQVAEKQELKENLINDPLTIEATARSYGLSKKNERIFYFEN